MAARRGEIGGGEQIEEFAEPASGRLCHDLRAQTGNSIIVLFRRRNRWCRRKVTNTFGLQVVVGRYDLVQCLIFGCTISMNIAEVCLIRDSRS